MNNENIVQRVWNLCNILRGDGISYHEFPDLELPHVSCMNYAIALWPKLIILEA